MKSFVDVRTTKISSSLATLRAEAAKIEADIDLFRLTQARELELTYARLTSDLEIEKVKRLADIETEEFKQHVTAIGPKTIQAIATSGPDNQVRLSSIRHILHHSLCYLG